MKKMFSRMLVFVLAVSTLVSAGATAFAAENDPTIEPYADGRYSWKIESKTYEGYTYGSWKVLDSFTVSKSNAPMNVSFSVSTAYKNSVTGEVKVTYSNLEASMGYDLDHSTTVTLTAEKENAPAGTYYLKARPVYKRWKVKQQRYYTIDGYTTKSGSPVYCYPKKFSHSEKTVTT